MSTRPEKCSPEDFKSLLHRLHGLGIQGDNVVRCVSLTFESRIDNVSIYLQDLVSEIERLNTKYKEAKTRNFKLEKSLAEWQAKSKRYKVEWLTSKKKKAAALATKIDKQKETPKYVSVLVNGDADDYLFNKIFLCQRLEGGLEAADAFLGRIRKYLKNLRTSIGDADNIEVVVKVYTSLEDDLALHINDVQCKHVILAPSHDSEHTETEELRGTGDASSGTVDGEAGGRQRGLRAPCSKSRQLSSSPKEADPKETDPKEAPKEADPKEANSKEADKNKSKRKEVANCAKLGPVLFNSNGQRVDRPLKVGRRARNLFTGGNYCYSHYLVADCVKHCVRKHDYPRPLSEEAFDTMWYLARFEKCSRAGNCKSDRCIYGH
ncbi:hypothetical protein GLAREA_06644 [Glarea lozoyensis ATCC 20868]|uniref:DUF7923 domain-containing protein n=1 Tax=Glarea lozoyensis (strain ATCC 20868 / MF5171) TaxID=1116229 RepID=S3DNF9_GLAL2|nr:uncharacterized protein GLAREA_06644 [Glarea lozoyensis ATCC 20868]EPE33631.1 hypothetical protein GLAREA_06644 [Glarea lozoyensis ATCC 20868]